MMENMVTADHDTQEIALLEEWLPTLSTTERAYIKGATEALLYAQDDLLGSCLLPQKESL